jgi:hypothetical protein
MVLELAWDFGVQMTKRLVLIAYHLENVEKAKMHGHENIY